VNLNTPHSGSQWDGKRQPFFEGWYYRLTLPAEREQTSQSLAFMYSIQAMGRTPATTMADRGGVGIQILGPDERYFSRCFSDLSGFWTWNDRLGHGHRRMAIDPVKGSYVESYSATAQQHAGQYYEPASGLLIRWSYSVNQIYEWGHPQSPQSSTAGWFSRFQLFEPGWQILMAHGLATGWFEWNDGLRHQPARLEFSDAPAYAEKNWGGAFPRKWFWLQCNAFEQEQDLAITSGGGIRNVLGWQESLAMVGIHHQGSFFEFVPWKGQIAWEVHPWGFWRVVAEQGSFVTEVVGSTREPGFQVKVPTSRGLEFLCRDTTRGHLSIRLWEKKGDKLAQIFRAASEQAALEVGGEGWTTPWCGNSSLLGVG